MGSPRAIPAIVLQRLRDHTPFGFSENLPQHE